MHQTWDVEVVLIPTPSAGPVLRVGAAEATARALDGLNLECRFYHQQDDEERLALLVVGVEPDGRSADELSAAVRGVVDELLRSGPELAGWRSEVTVSSGAADDADRATGPDGEAEDLDAEAARLVPAGDRLAEDLLHAIAYEQSVYADARLFAALPVEELSVVDVDALGEPERKAAVQRATALAGCLVQAATVVVDQLFDDITSLGATPAGRAPDVTQTWVLATLPPRFADRYTALFAQKFLVTLVDLSARLTRPWEPVACVAQELGLRVLLDQVEVIAQAADVALDDGWRGHLEDLLLDDADDELLYDPAFDGIEDEPSLGMTRIRFEEWFTPFAGRTLPPYVLPSDDVET